MDRFFIILCLISSVFASTTVQHHIYSRQMSRMARSDSQPSLSGYPYFGNADKFDSYSNVQTVYQDPIDIKTDEKLRIDSSIDSGPMNYPTIATNYMAHTPMYARNPDNFYKKSRNIDDMTKYSSPNFNADHSKLVNDMYFGYDDDFHNDHEDVRTSGRNSYDNYASFFYHNPYEHDHKNIDLDKAKDKRYATLSEKIIPVHEHIENDTFITPTYVSTTPTDNPIGGNGPFFSFVLNDYFDRNHEEDSLSFKGLAADWGKDFDHESYRPLDIIRKDRGLETRYFTPVVQWLTTERPVDGIYLRNVNTLDNDNNRLSKTYTNSHVGKAMADNEDKKYGLDNYDKGDKKRLIYKKSDGAEKHQYEGFKDFLDSFANKFGMAENNGLSNYTNEIAKDKGEKKNGFHRIYHKDEFLEDKEFFDRSNNSAKAADKGYSKFNFGGSEAILRSQALAAGGNAGNANTEFRDHDVIYDNSYRGDYDLPDSKFGRYINVAKQAARSNNADYVEHPKAWS